MKRQKDIPALVDRVFKQVTAYHNGKAMRQLAKYSFVNAKIRAMLSSLLDESRINALLEARDPGEALDILKKTPYGPLFLDADKDISRMPALSAL
jgi:vacuolar-type H+-ATPase subunit C/Vma6